LWPRDEQWCSGFRTHHKCCDREANSKQLKLGTAYLDVDFSAPPKVNMKFVNSKANERDETQRDLDDLEISCK